LATAANSSSGFGGLPSSASPLRPVADRRWPISVCADSKIKRQFLEQLVLLNGLRQQESVDILQVQAQINRLGWKLRSACRICRGWASTWVTMPRLSSQRATSRAEGKVSSTIRTAVIVVSAPFV
jgi:hypothetical protein